MKKSKSLELTENQKKELYKVLWKYVDSNYKQ